MVKFCTEIPTLLKNGVTEAEIVTQNSVGKGIDAVFFRWVQTSVIFSGPGSQKVLGKVGLILKLRDVKICSSFFFENY